MNVVVAAIQRQRDCRTEYLLSQRKPHQPLPYKWEFTGGKIESGETEIEALSRELHEEIGIIIDQQNCQKIIQIPWNYGKNFSLTLHLFQVLNYHGEPASCEQQNLKWFAPSSLSADILPEANKGLLTALFLPQHYAITPFSEQKTTFFEQCQHLLSRGIKLLQIRSRALPWHLEDQPDIKRLVALAQAHNCQLLLNSSLVSQSSPIKLPAGFSGWHLTAQDLPNHQKFKTSQTEERMLFSASVHNAEELEIANQAALDMICISPVLGTQSHPETSAGIGWNKSAKLCQNASMPVYFLGGMNELHLPLAIQCGAQGIASISAYSATG